jgi:glucose/arabinose dehydrogenase
MAIYPVTGTRRPRRSSREARLAVLLILAGATLSARSSTTAQPIMEGDLTVKLEDFHSFQTDPSAEIAPTDLVQLPDGRFLMATLGGTVRLLSSTGTPLATLMGPAETGVTKVDATHYGMTSIAPHPDFAQAGTFGYGKVYALITQQPVQVTQVTADFTITGSNSSSPFVNQDVVREYDLSSMLDSGTTSFVGQVISDRDILRIDQPQPSHNAFDLVFRSNGDLFVTSGDGGFTELTAFAGLHNRRQAAQDLDQVYGKILRINPDPDAYPLQGGQYNQYSIPGDNPFVNTTGALAEIYANGVRSPYRINLDPNDPTEETLWLGDVGEGSREEVSRVVKGSNLGWGRFEGTSLSNSGVTIQGNPATEPEFQYSHSPSSLATSGGLITQYNQVAGGNSITGGHIYRGELLGEEVRGLYIGANLGHHAGNPTRLARLFYGDPDATSVELAKFQFAPDSQQFSDHFLEADQFVSGFDFEANGITPGKFGLPQLILSISEDNSGELYVLGVDFSGWGTISRIVPAASFLPGDVDGINGVTLDDFEIIRDHFFTSVTQREDGDLNFDGFVDFADFREWKRNTFDGGAAVAPALPLPEPVSISLLWLPVIASVGKGRRHA